MSPRTVEGQEVQERDACWEGESWVRGIIGSGASSTARRDLAMHLTHQLVFTMQPKACTSDWSTSPKEVRWVSFSAGGLTYRIHGDHADRPRLADPVPSARAADGLVRHHHRCAIIEVVAQKGVEYLRGNTRNDQIRPGDRIISQQIRAGRQADQVKIRYRGFRTDTILARWSTFTQEGTAIPSVSLHCEEELDVPSSDLESAGWDPARVDQLGDEENDAQNDGDDGDPQQLSHEVRLEGAS